MEIIQPFGRINRVLRKFREVKYPQPKFNGQAVALTKRNNLGLVQQNLSKITLAQNYHQIYRGIKNILSAENQGLVEAQYVLGNKLYREQKDLDKAISWLLISAK